jgi:hypothetical protein
LRRLRRARGSAALGRLLLAAALWAGLPASAPATDGGADEAPTEYQVKAAFLFNFARFVEWPPSAFETATSPIGVCVLGDDPFGESLNRVVAGKTLGDRTMMVRRGKKLRELGGCEILFISASERPRLPEILEELRTTPVLTVGEGDDFATRGGEVQFILEDSHVHLLINVDATERAGLKVSSKLLSLAHVVHGDPLRKKS